MSFEVGMAEGGDFGGQDLAFEGLAVDEEGRLRYVDLSLLQFMVGLDELPAHLDDLVVDQTGDVEQAGFRYHDALCYFP